MEKMFSNWSFEALEGYVFDKPCNEKKQEKEMCSL